MTIPLYKIKIKKIIPETPDSVSFVFHIPSEYKKIFFYTPAQFLTFDFKIKNQNFLRSYSLSSSPILNEDLKTTVKRVKNGIISNYMIDHLKEGDTILSRKPAGRLFKPPKNLNPKHYFLFAGGSGITPLFSIIKTVLFSDSKNKVTLFYSNPDESSIIYKKELEQELSTYKNQFNIVYIFTQSKQTGNHIYERLSTEHLKKYFLNISIAHPHHLYYLCGPLGFMNTVENFLTQKPVNEHHQNTNKSSTLSPVLQKKQIHKENFYSAKQKKQLLANLSNDTLSSKKNNGDLPDDSSQAEIKLKGKYGESEISSPKIIKVLLNQERFEIPAEADISILEQLLSAGYSPPFSCLSGSCMSCLAVLKKGQVHQEEKGILEPENVKKSEFLSCQAIPKSQLVEIDYDGADSET